jgi:hypothetical protein
MSEKLSVRGKYAAYLVQEGPPCCGLSHGLTDWFESQTDLEEFIDSNYPGAEWPSPAGAAEGSSEKPVDQTENTEPEDGKAPEPSPSESVDEDDHEDAEVEGDEGEDEEGDEDEEDEDGDDDEVDDGISIAWTGTFENLCEDMHYQAQVVRVRFFEDLNSNHPDKKVDFSYDDSEPTPPVPEALRGYFDEWLASGELAFC